MKKILPALALGLGLIPGAAPANPWDPPKYITRPIAVHPVNYWWFKEPADHGNWDYFTPVSQPQEAVAVNKRYKLVYNSGYPFNGIQGYMESPAFLHRNDSRPR